MHHVIRCNIGLYVHCLKKSTTFSFSATLTNIARFLKFTGRPTDCITFTLNMVIQYTKKPIMRRYTTL